MAISKQRSEKIIWILILLLFAAVVVQIVWNIDEGPVKIWDEAFTAHNAIEMLETGDFLVINYDGEPDHFNTRPPLAVWTKALTFSIFGINPLAIRLPGVIASILMVFILVFLLKKLLKNPLYTIALLIVVSVTEGFLDHHVARTGDPDAILILFTTAYGISFFMLLHNYPEKRNFYSFLFGLGVVCAVYTKSIAGIYPLLPLLIYLLIIKSHRRLFADYRMWMTVFVSAILISSYYILREMNDPGFLAALWRGEFKLISNPYEVKHPEADFYLNYLINGGFKPFFYFLPLALFAFFATQKKIVKKILLFSALNFVVLLAGYSFITIKNEWYIAPIYPYLWILTAVGFTETVLIIAGRIRREVLRNTFVIVVYILLIIICYPYYLKIFRMNTADPLRYSFKPEIAGYFLEKTKEEFPSINEFTVLTEQPTRQLKYYSKKHNFLDGSMVKIDSSFLELGTPKNLIICDAEQQLRFEKEHRFHIIKEDSLCKLYSNIRKK